MTEEKIPPLKELIECAFQRLDNVDTYFKDKYCEDKNPIWITLSGEIHLAKSIIQLKHKV